MYCVSRKYILRPRKKFSECCSQCALKQRYYLWDTKLISAEYEILICGTYKIYFLKI